MNKMIFGSGKPAVGYNGNLLIFDYGESVVKWTDEYEDIRTLDGRDHRFYDGSRIQIRLKLKHILEDREHNRLYSLMKRLNSARSAGDPVMVYPHYTGSLHPQGYECKVPVGFDLEKLGRMSVGQGVELVFEGTHRFDGVRPYYDQTRPVRWMLHAGGSLELYDGDKFEFKQ